MRLLNIHSYAFREFHGENIPPYIIASHRWCDDETTFKDVLKKRNKDSKGWQKVEGFCERARRDNELLESFENATCCEWIWIDTACIDKKSSAEVSESINSMFEWYTKAQECHAYMADVKPFPTSQQLDEVLDDFANSEWFKRGWTLQELLAPRCVVFFTSTWQIIGHKCSHCSDTQSCKGAGPLLNSMISQVTGIPEEVLGNYERSKSLAVEEKMKWQVGRRTTRTEDRAYCLLGIFDVHMPLLYGEGEKAMLRLERTVFEELERPWQSQLRLNFNDSTCVDKQFGPAQRGGLRSGRPLAGIMRHSDVEGEVVCICGYDDDDGYLVACNFCQYWQHAICYFPAVEHQEMSGQQEHGCLNCRPRELDIQAAKMRQRDKRSKGSDPPTPMPASAVGTSGKEKVDEDESATLESLMRDLAFLETPVDYQTSQLLKDNFDFNENDRQWFTLFPEEFANDSSVAGVEPARVRDKPLPQIMVDENDTVALKRARNTAAARKSRAKKVEEREALEAKIVDLEAQVKHWKLLAQGGIQLQSSDTASTDEKVVPSAPLAGLTSTPVEHAFPPSGSGAKFSSPDHSRSVADPVMYKLQHKNERPEKCPIPTCNYYNRRFARKYDKDRHILTHYKGEMTCDFCSESAVHAVRTFNRADVFKRHLTSVHGVEQAPPDLRKEDSRKGPEANADSGQCSICRKAFPNPQAFYDHLDECVLRTIRGQKETVSYTCPHEECASAGVAFEHRKDLERHAQTRHGDSELRMFECSYPECGKVFTRKDKLLEHQRVVHRMEVSRRSGSGV